MRGGIAVGKACNRTHQLTTVMSEFVLILVVYHYQAFALFECYLQAFFKPVSVVRTDDQFIDKHFHIVVLVAVQPHARNDFL
ncbi:MAG: hypothetical protein BWX77_00649 [Bacteroidetes bacterium ADurb.Bin090]|nr:MAG: hypothetical protein BWX77_00649 [Bacteroidetes bacterium ADurb.Bin090]